MAKKVHIRSMPDKKVAVTFPAIQKREVYEPYQITTVVPEQIYQVQQCFTASNSKTFLCFFKETIVSLLSEPVAPRRGEVVRTNQRFSIHDPSFAEYLFRDTGLDVCAEELKLSESGHRTLKGLNPNIRVYRYSAGALFGPHYDDSVTDPQTKWTSEWTLLIYLTEGDLDGGETAFHISKNEMIAPPIVHGSALLHKHGRDCLLHEGRPVKSGIKWVLRSDFMYA